MAGFTLDWSTELDSQQVAVVIPLERDAPLPDMPKRTYEFHTDDHTSLRKVVAVLKERGFEAGVLEKLPPAIEVDFDVEPADMVNFVRYALFVQDLSAGRPIRAENYKKALLLSQQIEGPAAPAAGAAAAAGAAPAGAAAAAGAATTTGAAAAAAPLDPTELARQGTEIKRQLLATGSASLPR